MRYVSKIRNRCAEASGLEVGDVPKTFDVLTEIITFEVSNISKVFYVLIKTSARKVRHSRKDFCKCEHEARFGTDVNYLRFLWKSIHQ